MQTPTQAARQRDNAGARLPQPWRDADANKVHFRRGQLAMLVAAPGVGKSVLATAYVVQSGVRCLYLSMDTDAFTTSVRLVAAELKCTLEEAEAGVIAQADWAMAALSRIPNARYAFTSSPDEREIAERMIAYREAEGDYPELVVVDNLANVAFEDEEFSGLRRLMRDLQSTAVATGSAILTLHHATGEYEDGQKPIPQSGAAGKLSKFPAMILTAYTPNPGNIGINVVKNRFGPADPAGNQVRFTLAANLERVWVANDDNPIVWRTGG